MTGQGIKGAIIAFKPVIDVIKKIADRRRSKHCDFIHGDYEDFKIIMKQNKQLVGKIVIVQPSISASKSVPDKIQRILAASNFYINNSGKVKSLSIWESL